MELGRRWLPALGRRPGRASCARAHRRHGEGGLGRRFRSGEDARGGGPLGACGWGKAGVERGLAAAIDGVPEGVSTDSLLGLAAYPAKPPTRFDHAGRLAAGMSLDSGAVEGAVQQRVDGRMKRTGDRGKVEPVGPFVELLALCETPEWEGPWVTACCKPGC